MTPDQYCEDKVARSGTSFYYSFLYLSKERRQAIHALYAFCREVDDVVDECTDANVARNKLDWWQHEIERTFAGRAEHPVGKALETVVRNFDLPQARFGDILAGMRMDLDYNRYPDFPTLEVYCHRVAGVVGLLSAKIFGYKNPRTLEFANQLGIALQLTNIIRDVREDIDRNRLYLPLSELEQFGVPIDDVITYRDSAAFHRLMTHQVQRAEQRYELAHEALAEEDRRAQRPGLIMGNIYRSLLREIERGGCKVLSERTGLTPLRKFWIAWKTWVSAA